MFPAAIFFINIVKKLLMRVKPNTILPFVLTFILGACQPPFPTEDAYNVFRYNEASGISSLDPAYAKDLANIWPCNQLYNGLVQMGDHLEVKPCIAKNWTINDSGNVYTFYLRDDVYFHDNPLFTNGVGRKVIAYDFVYSFNRIVDPENTSPGAWVFNTVERNEGVYSFKALNDSILQIRLNTAFHPFLGILTMQYCAVVPHEVVENYGNDFRKHPVGTGPFKFRVWKEGIKLVLVRNENYFEFEGENQLPFLDGVAVSFLADKQAAFLEFVKGNLDFMSGIDASYKDEILTRDGRLKAKYNDRFRMESVPYLNTEYLGILVEGKGDSDSDPLRSKLFRQALNYGFDRARMIKYLRNNIGNPGYYGIIPPGFQAFDASAPFFFYDPGKARELIRMAGYRNGSAVPEITLHTTPDYLDICKFLQHQLQEIGVSLKIEVDPAATLRELRAQSKIGFFRASWIADYPDEENYLSLFYSPNFSPGGPNYTHFKNLEYDSLYRLSQGMVDDSIRLSFYRTMNRMIMDESPVIILYYDQVVRFVQDDVSGLGINPLNQLDLKRVRKQNKKNDKDQTG